MKNSILTLLLVAGLCASAQVRKNQCWITVGVSAPMGDYGSTAAVDGGFAKPGVNLNLNYQHNFGEWFGLAVTLRGALNGFDDDEQVNALNNAYPGSNWNVESGNWRNRGIQAGPVLIWQTTERLHFETKILFGYTSAANPKLKATESTMPAGFTQTSSRASSFMLSICWGAKIFLKNTHWFIPIQADLSLCAMKFKDIQTTETLPSGTETYNVAFNQTLSTFNLSAGFGYAF